MTTLRALILLIASACRRVAELFGRIALWLEHEYYQLTEVEKA